MICREFLQTLYLAEAEHGTFPSSKRQVRILDPFAEPSTGFLMFVVPDDRHGYTLRSKFTGHSGFRIALALHWFSFFLISTLTFDPGAL